VNRSLVFVIVILGLLGIGLDNEDGHTRITKGEDFFLVGGSQETHEKMQEFTIRLTEQLHKRGKRIKNVPIRELRDIADELRGQLEKDLCGLLKVAPAAVADSADLP